MHIRHNVQLQQLNTFGVQSEALCACEIDSLDNIAENISEIFEHANQLVLLGGGSNVILAPEIDACVLRLTSKEIQVFHESDEIVLVKAGAGVVWHDLVETCTRQGFFGLENLALIPGCVGAAPIQNIGAYGVELQNVFVSLEALNVLTGEVKIFQEPDCEFSYRHSVFKGSAKNRFIVLSVTFRLNKTAKVNISYPALEKALSEKGIDHPSPLDVFNAVVSVRQSKLPDPQHVPNAGSFFKNPIVDESQYAEIKHNFPQIPSWAVDANTVKLSAAWMIDQLGWKGKWVEGIRVHPEHALVLTNPNLENALAILSASKAIQESVHKHFGVSLEREPELIGEIE